MYWPNACGHSEAEYVGSFTCFVSAKQGERMFDLYVTVKQEVCIRYGPEKPSYMSPGTIFEFLTHADGDVIKLKAAELLFKEGTFKWERRLE